MNWIVTLTLLLIALYIYAGCVISAITLEMIKSEPTLLWEIHTKDIENPFGMDTTKRILVFTIIVFWAFSGWNYLSHLRKRDENESTND